MCRSGFKREMPFAAVATQDMTHEKEMRLFKYTDFFPGKADSLLRKDERRLISPEKGKANSDQHVGAEGRTISKHEPLLCSHLRAIMGVVPCRVSSFSPDLGTRWHGASGSW